MSHGRFNNPIVASLAGFADLFRPQPLAQRLTDQDRFDGKTVLITGANSGLGFAMTTEIANRGGKVMMACRSDIPGAEQRARKRTGCDSITQLKLDLSNISSIHQFVNHLSDLAVTIDVLILNAATTLPEARRTTCGQDEMFLVNYLANFILVRLLLRKGVLLPDMNRTPKIIVISSESHQSASAIDYSEFGRYFDYGVAKAINNYSYFKLILNTFATELSRRINAETLTMPVNVVCPGPVNSNIIKEAPTPLRLLLRIIFTVIFKSPGKAALAPVYLAASDDFAGKTNQYLHMFKAKSMDQKTYDVTEGNKLWEASEDLWQQIDPDALSGRLLPA